MTALAILDYAQAPTAVAYFLGANVFSILKLQTGEPSPHNVQKRRIALILMFLVVISYVTEAVYYLNHSLIEQGVWPPQHTVLHIMESILGWGCLNLALMSMESSLWHPLLGAWIIGFLFETGIGIFSIESLAKYDSYHAILLAIQAFRVISFAALVGNGYFLIIQSEPEAKADEERQSLLGNEFNDSTDANETPYGTTTSGAGSDDEDKEIKEKQRKRLEENGGWVGYLMEFGVFIPYLWPRDNRWIQFCFFILGANVVLERFLNVLTPRQLGIITDKLTDPADAGTMPWKDILLWTFYQWIGSSAGFSLIKGFASVHVENYSYQRICNLAFGHIMSLSMDFHSDKDSGEVLKSADQAGALTDLLDLALFTIAPIFIDLVVSMWYVSHLFDIYLAFITLLTGICFIWLGIATTSWIQPYHRTYTEKARAENKTIYESVSNWQTVSYFNRTKYEQERYGESVKNSTDSQWSYYFRYDIGYAAQSLILILGLLSCSFLATWRISKGQKPVGNFVTLVMYWRTMMNPLHTIANMYRKVATKLIAAERLLQLLNTKPSVSNSESATRLSVSQGKVEFKAVSFSYDSRKDVLKGIDFVAEPNQTVALVGATGSGKSSTLKLLCRFYDVTEGSVTIDDQDVSSVTLSSLHDALGVVPQDPSLFNMSILENVRYAKLDATDKEIHEACKAAAVHDKIISFPDGYNSKVGERGVKLSGGELQRLAIARVLLKNPKIVILDEATSAVDSITEARIQEAFEQLSEGRTTFIVAHRLSTIVDADQILVISEGEIIERGTHEDLLNLGGKYYELWTQQTSAKHGKSRSHSVTDVEDPRDSDNLKDADKLLIDV